MSPVRYSWCRIGTTVRLLIAALTVTILSCGGGNVIKVGVIAPLTGDVKTFGESVCNGVMLAIDEANAAGGINGKQIKLIVSDDKNDPTEAANAGGKLIDMDGVVAIIGSVSSKCSLPLADKCQVAHIPMITPTSTNPKVTTTDDGKTPFGTRTTSSAPASLTRSRARLRPSSRTTASGPGTQR